MYFLPTSFAYLLATAFWLSAWNTLILGSSGTPESLDDGISSSTTTGSTMYEGTPSSSPISLARIPPRFDACCPCLPIFKSSNNSSLTGYVPPGIGFNIPPRPTHTSNVLMSKFFSARTSRITFFLKSF